MISHKFVLQVAALHNYDNLPDVGKFKHHFVVYNLKRVRFDVT